MCVCECVHARVCVYVVQLHSCLHLKSSPVPLTVVPERTSVIVQLEDGPSTSVVLSCKVEGYPGPRGTFWLRVDEGGLLRPVTNGATTRTVFGGNTTFPVVLLAQLTVDLTTSGVFTYMLVLVSRVVTAYLCT